MKYLVFLFLLFFVFSIASAEPYLTRDMPSTIEVGEEIKVTLIINPDSEQVLDVAEFIPAGWEISDWVVSPKVKVEYESQTREFMDLERNMNHWKFDSVTGEIKIEYTVTAKESENYEFIVLLVSPSGFDTVSEEIEVTEKNTETMGGSITGRFVQEIEQVVPIKTTEKRLEFSLLKTSLANAKNMIFEINY